MTITLNGMPAAPGARALTDLIGLDREGIAVAVNGEVVPRGRWGATTLHDGDVIDVVTAVQGG